MRIRGRVAPLPCILLALSACGGGETTPPPTPDALEIVTASLPGGGIGDAYDEKLAASGGTAPYQFEIKLGALPDGLELLKNQGRITGMLEAPGTFEFTLSVSDAAGAEVTKDLSIAVEADPLVITTPRLDEAFTTVEYEFTLEAFGGVEPVRFTVDEASLPAGIALSSAGVLSGTPTETGTFPLDLTATDAAGTTANKSLTLTVRSGTPMLETETLPAALIDNRYEVRLMAAGGAEPYTFTVVTGALPNGLQLQEDGLIFGEPDTAGEYQVGIQVEDSRGNTDSRGYTVLVIEPLVVATRNLPIGVVGELYRFELQAQGGLPPYTWSTGDPLPAGITLTPEGLFMGTPTTLGEWQIRVRVQDATQGVPRSARLTLRVRDVRSYEVTPGLAFPPVCTSTIVSYQTAEIQVPDSFAIQNIEISVDLTYSDSESNDRDRLKVVLFAPDGRRTVLCGNGAGVRGSSGCPGSGNLQLTYGATGANPQVPLHVFTGMNPQGTWRFQAAVIRPTTDGGGSCEQAGVINRVGLTMEPDPSSDPYVIWSGFTYNNLLIDPWVRITAGGIDQDTIHLGATLWHPGMNGRREGGLGDDVPDPVEFTFSGSNLPTGTIVAPDGTVTSSMTTSKGMPTSVTAVDATGTYSETRPLHVTPPDWNPMIRNY